MPNQVGRMSTSPLSRIQPSLFVSLMIAAMLANITGCAGPGMRLSMAPRSAERLGAENAAALEQINQQYQTGDLQGAYDAVRKHRRKHPYSWEARVTEACIASDLGRTTESIQAWQAVVTANPQSAKVLHEAGMHLVQLGAISAGLPVLQSAVERDPSNVNYRLDLSAAYLASGNSHTAQAVLMQAHRQLPQEPVVPVAIARLFESQNVHNRAAHYYGVALKQSPEDPTLLRQRGRMWYQLRNYELAQIDLAACEESMIAVGHWPALLEYGQVCLKTGDVQSARRVATALGQKPAALTPEFQQFSVAVAATPVPMPALVPDPEEFSLPDVPPALLPAAPTPTFVAQRVLPIQQAAGIIVRNSRPPQPIAHTQPAEIPSVMITAVAAIPIRPTPPTLLSPVAASSIAMSPIATGPVLTPPATALPATKPSAPQLLPTAPPTAETGWRTTRIESKKRKPVRATPAKTLKSAAKINNGWKSRVANHEARITRRAADAQTLVKKKAATD